MVAGTSFALNIVEIITAYHSPAATRLVHKLDADHNWLKNDKNSVVADSGKSLYFVAETSGLPTVVEIIEAFQHSPLVGFEHSLPVGFAN